MAIFSLLSFNSSFLFPNANLNKLIALFFLYFFKSFWYDFVSGSKEYIFDSGSPSGNSNPKYSLNTSKVNVKIQASIKSSKKQDHILEINKIINFMV